MADQVPRVDRHPETGVMRWHVGEVWMHPVASTANTGWPEYAPNFPTDWDLIDKGSYDPVIRLQRLDELGIYAQTLYPNLVCFSTGVFMGMEPDVAITSIRAYNDFLTEFASVDTDRLIPIAMVPFWDVDECVKEIERTAAAGHRGVLFANQFEKLGLPRFEDPHWDPVYDAAQSLGLSMNFHAGFANSPKPKAKKADVYAFGKWTGDIGALAANVATTMLISNTNAFGTILTCGIAERFPRLRFVSVESGVGYIPFLLESLDWHFKGYGVHRTGRRLPSEVFRAQCYGAFWFETSTFPLFDLFPDNFLFSTDYPHATSLTSGPASPSLDPGDHIAAYFGELSTDVVRKVLWDNAAGLYGLKS
jgi:predicted TIM-barrel fold metal-dependent hydrolase